GPSATRRSSIVGDPVDDTISVIRLTDELRRSAAQQPEWSGLSQVQRVGEMLASRPSLVRAADVRTLRALLAEVALGEAMVVQAGDCSEDPEESTLAHVRRKSALLDVL